MKDFTITIPVLKLKISFDPETKKSNCIVSYPINKEVAAQLAGLQLAHIMIDDMVTATTEMTAKDSDPELLIDLDKMQSAMAVLESLTRASLDAVVEYYIDLPEQITHEKEVS